MTFQSIFFYQLLLAHFLSDYCFQTNRVFAIKIKYPWGVTLHAFICGCTWAIFSIPYLQNVAMWFYVLFFGFILHLIIDKSKMTINRILKKDNIWFFLLDQVLHVACAAALVALAGDMMPYPLVPEIARFFNDAHIIRVVTWYVVVTYVVNILIFMLKLNYFKSYFEKITLPAMSIKYLGIVERALIASCVWWGGWGLFLIPLAVGPSLYLANQKEQKVTKIDLMLGWMMAVAVGVGLKFV